MKKVIAALLLVTAIVVSFPLEQSADPSTSPRIQSVNLL